MKRIALIAAAFFSFSGAFAQNSAIQSAKNYLRENDYDNAIKYIDQALNDASTKDKAKTHYTRGDIYMQMYLDTTYKTDPPSKRLLAYKEAGEAYLKVVSLDADYERSDVNVKLATVAGAYYNNGVELYRKSSYKAAIESFEKVLQIDKLEGGKRTKEILSFYPQYKEVIANAKEMMGYSAFNEGKFEEAVAVFNQVKGEPSASNPTLFISLSEAYGKLGKKEEQLAAIQEGRKAFPNDANLRNEEINYYITTDRIKELTSKLEDAISKDPNNAELLYTLANIYNNMANPKSGEKPANAAELTAKAEAGYLKALAASPDNAEYNFNFSVLYYMQAYDIVQAMNKLGETADDLKKYKTLNAEKDELFKKALPYAEKAYTLLDSRAAELKGKEKEVYMSTLSELVELYGKMNMKEKYEEISKKKEAYK